MKRQAKRQSPLYFRVKLLNPDRSLNWLEPKLRWLFSRELAVMTALATLFAIGIVWSNRQELVDQFLTQFTWRTAILAWATTITITIAHEYGHGLACKRYGGQVPEMGLLWIFFTPCFFCNVSDAWLLSSRWQRLLISMAGTYIDLLVWIGAVFTWRVAEPGTAIHYFSWVIVTTCGLRVLFNMNPFMRMDGYYALSDLLDIHNLRRRGRERWMEYVRWILWGAPRPTAIAHGKVLLSYSMVNWFFTVSLLAVMSFQLSGWLRQYMGIAGIVPAVALFFTLSRNYFRGSLGTEFTQMIKSRKTRIALLAAAIGGVLLIPIRDRASGPFQVRPTVHFEVRAQVAGFLREVNLDEGSTVEAGGLVVRMEVPELLSQITRKEAELNESEAQLRRLLAGRRPEEINEQRARVTRAIAWCDQGENDLRQARLALQEDLARLELRITRARGDFEYCGIIFNQAQGLFEKGGLAERQLLSEKRRVQEAESLLLQSEAERRSREAAGVLVSEGELTRRKHELADARAALVLLEAGSRPEDIEAERARSARLVEELKHLKEMQKKEPVYSPVAGTVNTPRLREKVGQYLERRALICIIEDPQTLEAEIAVSEQDAKFVQAGQEVLLKPRSLPYAELIAKVDRIAPRTQNAEAVATSTNQVKPLNTEGQVIVYCQVQNPDGMLCTGMTGFGRIYNRTRSLGWIIWRPHVELCANRVLVVNPAGRETAAGTAITFF